VRKIVTTLVDDLDEHLTADESVWFHLDGRTYTIDLSKGNAAVMRRALKRYINAARRVRVNHKAVPHVRLHRTVVTPENHDAPEPVHRTAS
jgi:hypothetical protein